MQAVRKPDALGPWAAGHEACSSSDEMVTRTDLELPPERLARRCDLSELPFESTAELADPAEPLGQTRALDALLFATGMRWRDYNVYVLGPSGLGKHTLVRPLLEKRAAASPAPSAWCYVHNFEARHAPKAIRMPPGEALALRDEMERVLSDLRGAITAALEGDELRARREKIEEEDKRLREDALSKISNKAAARDVVVIRAPDGFGLAPRRGEQLLSPEEVHALPEDERTRVLANIEAVEGELKDLVNQNPRWDRDMRTKLRALLRETLSRAAEGPIGELRKRFEAIPELSKWFDQVERDVIDHADLFVQTKRALSTDSDPPETSELRRYGINVMIDPGTTAGAPVVYEAHPTHPNLIGSIEHASIMGTLVTHHGLIKPGALHRANGGYLILDALELLSQPFAWEALKRALKSSEIRIDTPAHSLGLISTESLVPDAIPLDVKVILLGTRRIYYLLRAFDPVFEELFKIPVDLEEDADWTPGSSRSFASTIAAAARREHLHPFKRDAVGRVLEHASRSAEDSTKISLRAQELDDLLREADRLAGEAGASVVGADHVQAAIDAQIRRADRIRRLVYERIRRRTLKIEVDGARVGQVNGLSVVSLGGFSFGQPSRISARVRLGRGHVVDVEREVELAGPIHSKGVLILEGFVMARFGVEMPLSLAGTLVFEQSYGAVEGDSAAAAEACALISALAEVPLAQSIAVTGSVDQFGEVQAVGGLNEKVEGFFDVCGELGLTGGQGVVVPAANVANLMLRRDVVGAVLEKRFHVYAVRTVDEILTLLTGLPAGERGADGRFPEGSINARAEARLSRFAEAARRFASRDASGDRTNGPEGG